MQVSPISNFAIPDTPFSLSDVAKILWLNDGTVEHVQMTLSSSAFTGYAAELQEQIEQSWLRLQSRAQADIAAGSAFRFYTSEILLWEDMQVSDGFCQVSVAPGLSYKDITAVRSDQAVYDACAQRPSAFVLMNILLTADNKIVLGRRPYYGDWPNNTYECPGSFLKPRDIAVGNLGEVAQQKVRDDYIDAGAMTAVPSMICAMPRVMETLLLYVTTTSLVASELQSDFYTNTQTLENNSEGKQQLAAMDIDLFHPPSRVALQAYFENTSFT